MKLRAVILLLFSASLFGAEFQSGQAAYAVLDQTSFTSRDPGPKVSSMVIEHGRLHAADASHRVLTFDLLKLPDVRDDFAARQANGCSVCGLAPVSETNESVMPGVATVSVWGKSVAIADPSNHRVLLWRDSKSPRPDIVLGQATESSTSAGTLVNPVSVALDGKRVFVGDAALHRVLVWDSFPVSDDQPADVVLGQPDFNAANANDSPEPNSIVDPAAMASDGTNLFVADAVDRRILVFSPGDRALPAGSVVNSASLVTGAIAPGTLITVAGTALSEDSASADAVAGHPLPKRLGGVEVVLNGQALPLLSVSPTEAQAQAPYDFGTQSAASLYLRTEHAGGVVSVTTAVEVKIVPASPGLFAFTGSEPRRGILLHSAVSQTQGGSPVTEEIPARPGEVITIWAAGLGAVSEGESNGSAVAGVPFDGPAAQVLIQPSAQVNGQPAQVLSAKLPEGATGVYQIEIALPQALEPNTLASLSVAQNGYGSNTVSFPVR